MLPDQVSNPGPLTYESGALPIVLRGQALHIVIQLCYFPFSLLNEVAFLNWRLFLKERIWFSVE